MNIVENIELINSQISILQNKIERLEKQLTLDRITINELIEILNVEEDSKNKIKF